SSLCLRNFRLAYLGLLLFSFRFLCFAHYFCFFPLFSRSFPLSVVPYFALFLSVVFLVTVVRYSFRSEEHTSELQSRFVLVYRLSSPVLSSLSLHDALPIFLLFVFGIFVWLTLVSFFFLFAFFVSLIIFVFFLCFLGLFLFRLFLILLFFFRLFFW